MARQLEVNVHVRNPETFEIEAFGPDYPDKELPEWAESKLVADGTPGLWAEGDEPKSESASDKTQERKSSKAKAAGE
jgi:hypothetical protein